jgi:hypothetical protein
MNLCSFGAGVQSSAIALLAYNKDPRLLEVTGGVLPDRYLFADTGDEPPEVYKQLELFESMVPIERVYRFEDRRTLADQLCGRLESCKQTSVTWIPGFVETGGRSGPIQRRCTHTMKVEALDRASRRIAEVPRGCKTVVVRTWLGISLDEISRCKTSREPWRKFFYPLIEMGWRRGQCIRYLEDHGFSTVRSACVYCPFRSNREWERMRTEEPHNFAAATAFEQRLHKAYDALEEPALRSKPYLHRTRDPIDQVDFTGGQIEMWSAMEQECAGVCGV